MASFSERYGHKKPRVQSSYEEIHDEAKTRMWNLFYQIFGNRDSSTYDFLARIWDEFLKKDLIDFQSTYGATELCRWIWREVNNGEWYRIYDFIEFVWKESPYHGLVWDSGINRILYDEGIPCQLINGVISPITNPEEITEIQKALGAGDDYRPAREHLDKAFSILADRKKSDFANSIKESISALESLAKILLKDKNGTLGDLTKKLDIHPAFREGLSKLYGWTSKDGGIRHGKVEGNLNPSLADARFMIVLASAFFNYLISVYIPSEK